MSRQFSLLSEGMHACICAYLELSHLGCGMDDSDLGIYELVESIDQLEANEVI